MIKHMCIGGLYNWRGQPERLKYIGHNWSGNGYWHQFEKVGAPGVVWCEVLDHDLPMIEETFDADPVENLIVSKLVNHTCEIEQWNAAVEAKNAEKKARKQATKGQS